MNNWEYNDLLCPRLPTELSANSLELVLGTKSLFSQGNNIEFNMQRKSSEKGLEDSH